MPIGRVKDEDVIDYADEETDGDSAVFEDEWLNSGTMAQQTKTYILYLLYLRLCNNISTHGPLLNVA